MVEVQASAQNRRLKLSRPKMVSRLNPCYRRVKRLYSSAQRRCFEQAELSKLRC